MHDTEIGNEEKPFKNYLIIKSYRATYAVNANSLFENLLQVSSNSNSSSINILTWLDKQHIFLYYSSSYNFWQFSILTSIL